MVQQIRDELKKLPSKDRAGVVAFGGDANVEQFVSDTVKFTELNSVRVETETNIEKDFRQQCPFSRTATESALFY